jgi:hypothetical protein
VPDWDFPINRSEIPQRELDLESRPRTNPFPWRGQFSPGLVEVLLARYAPPGGLVLDPFCGVGTTLVEAARRDRPSIGAEINPAAVAMAETAMFVNVPASAREQILSRAAGCPNHATNDALIRNVMVNVLIRTTEGASPADALRKHAAIVLGLPHTDQPCRVIQADARALPIESGSVSFILASPPYINVFNYHQNCRKAMESLGWNLLDVARSEFGANRKHRGNRFLTVIQYSLDIHAALAEARRVATDDARMILILGRESSVRGVSFRNGEIVSALARPAGWSLFLRQERKFQNKFGGVIYEDVLHFRKSPPDCQDPRQIAIEALSQASNTPGIAAAIQTAQQVLPSPLWNPPSPCSLLLVACCFLLPHLAIIR